MNVSSPLTLLCRLGCVAAAVGATLAVAACGGSDKPKSPGTAAAQDRGGTLRIRISLDEGCLDPQQVRTRSQILATRQLVDSLTFQDDRGRIVPWLASKWKINADSTAFTFTIRKGVTFSDGTPLDAAAVKANIEHVVGMGAAAVIAAPYVAGLSSATAAGDTVTIRFKKPAAQFLQASSTPALGILSPATLAESAGQRCGGKLVGSGPFTIAGYQRNSSIQLKRRTGYAWAPQGFANQGEALLDGIKISIVPDGAVGTGELLSGQVDLNADVPPQDVDRIMKAGKVLTKRPNPGIATPFLPNIKSAPLDELAVRQGINLALNRQELAATALSAVETPATGIFSPVTPGYKAQPELVRYDPAAAAKALDQAGWTLGGDGMRHKDGKALSVRIMYFTPAQTPYLPYLQLAQQELKKVGIATKLQPATIAQLVANERSGNFDLEYLGLTRGDPDVLSKFAGRDARMDGLLARLSAESDPAKRDAIAAQAEDYAMQQVWSIPMHNFTYPLAYSKSLTGLKYDDSNTPYLSEASLAR